MTHHASSGAPAPEGAGVTHVAFGRAWHIAPEHADEIRGLLAACRSAADWGPVETLKQDRGSRVFAAGRCVIKESGPRKGRGLLRFGLRRSGSRRAFRIGRRLVALGTPTPEPLAWATERRLGLRVRDFLITRRMEGAEALKDRCLRAAALPGEREEILVRIGALAAAFHRHGLSNRDLKDENILCAAGAPLALWVVDLDGVRRLWGAARHRAQRDLWPIARSLRRLGWSTAADEEALLRGYNGAVTATLRRAAFPYLRDTGPVV